MDVNEYHQDLLTTVGAIADAEGDYVPSAFTRHAGALLAEGGEFDSFESLHFEGIGSRRRTLRVNGYDLEKADDSVSLVVSHFLGGPNIEIVPSNDAKSHMRALRNFLEEAVSGTFLLDREESTAEYQLAYDLRNRGGSVSRYRLHLLTDGRLSDRMREMPTEQLGTVPVDFHVWDIDRLHQLGMSQFDHEALSIDLLELTESGLPTLRVGGNDEFSTYLACVPGRLISSLYGRYGSRLLESNVRSYLSNRGKVNRGIKDTIIASPEKFLAYNNGLTATAAGVTLNSDGSKITTINDLQIVNGGQTTASLFFVEREKGTGILDDVFVQMKLVVVDPKVSENLVPNISRFANSQNAVSASDFFSNSPYHVRMQMLSRQTVTPANASSTVSTKWYYERTKGQYDNERNKLTPKDRGIFDKINPKSQRFDKPAIAKYIMAWEQNPHVVSMGAQKNFVAFAKHVSSAWDKDKTEEKSTFNEQYFKESVAKGLLFEQIRSGVAKADWYRDEPGYLANIVAYSVAKLAHMVATLARGRQMDFDRIWQHQSVPQPVLDAALQVARRVRHVLTDPRRPVLNVTEWAKREECWDKVRSLPIEMPSAFVASLIDPQAAQQRHRDARDAQKIDSGIMNQSRALQISTDEWRLLMEFALKERLVTPTDLGILKLVTKAPPALVSEKQAARLLALIGAANRRGFTAFEP
ncbi:AIPR family protein [Arthrobacter cupressi]